MNGGRREVAVVRGGIFCGPDSFCRGPSVATTSCATTRTNPGPFLELASVHPHPSNSLSLFLSLSLCPPHGQGNRTCRYLRRTRFAFSRQYSCLVTTTPSRAASCDPVFRAKVAAEWKADTFIGHSFFFLFYFSFWKDREIFF